MSRYTSWREPKDIERAEKIERDLEKKLGRRPTQQDFKNERLYNVWMALYRYRSGKSKFKRAYSGTFSKEYFFKIRKKIIATRQTELLETILRDIILTLGRYDAEKSIDKIFKDAFGSLYIPQRGRRGQRQ
jgi:hypothetical protein